MWPDHCVQETLGATFHPYLEREDGDVVVRKGTNARVDSYRYGATKVLHSLVSPGRRCAACRLARARSLQPCCYTRFNDSDNSVRNRVFTRFFRRGCSGFGDARGHTLEKTELEDVLTAAGITDVFVAGE